MSIIPLNGRKALKNTQTTRKDRLKIVGAVFGSKFPSCDREPPDTVAPSAQ